MVHIIFDGADLRLENFSQSGSGSGYSYFEGLPLIHQRGYGYFAGYPLVYQRGHGIGDIFRSIYRALRPMAMKVGSALAPIAKEAGEALGKEGIATSARVLNDIVQGKHVKESVLSEGREGLRRLLDKGHSSLQNKLQQGTGRKKTKRAYTSNIILKPRLLEGKAVKLKKSLGTSNVKIFPLNKSKKPRHDTLGYY